MAGFDPAYPFCIYTLAFIQPLNGKSRKEFSNFVVLEYKDSLSITTI
jgi:hypothetical protein